MKSNLALPSYQGDALLRPVGMPSSLVWLFAVASGLCVANVYYAQPLLDTLALDFGISYAAVGGVIAATSWGCSCWRW